MQTRHLHIASSVDWKAVERRDLPRDWHLYRSLVLRALDAGEGSYGESDVLGFLLSGEWQIWAFGEPPLSICVISLGQFPGGRKLFIRYISGEWWPFAENLDMVESVAREYDCRRIEAHMRRGLTRKLPSDWKADYVIMARDLDNGGN